MCGLAGVVLKSNRLESEAFAVVLETMANTMIARGPDAFGTWCEPENGVGFAHR